MVHVVNNSLYGYGYREINQQLAKDNGELRQQLSLVISENSHQREEIHRRDVQIIELKRQINELVSIQAKFNAIRDIILDKRPVEPMRRQTTSIQAIEQSLHERDNSIPLPLPSTSHENSASPLKSLSISSSSSSSTPNNDTSSTTTADEPVGDSTFDAEPSQKLTNVLERISERSEEDGASSLSPSHLRSPSRSNTPANDSLDPPNVTSVPPLQPERTMHTPSIWNCLDPLDSINLSNNDMFHSTPVHSQKNAPNKNVVHGPDIDNQENVQSENKSEDRPPQEKQTKKGRGKRQPPVIKEVTFDNEPKQSRYNLRKRTKV